LIIGICLPVLALGLGAGCESPPTQLSTVAWQAIQDSKREGADESAPDIWGMAKARYDSAWLIIETQNRFWFFERDFEQAESRLGRATI
jgi:hypothetical protein